MKQIRETLVKIAWPGAMLEPCWSQFLEKAALEDVLARSWAALVPNADWVPHFGRQGPMGYHMLADV